MRIVLFILAVLMALAPSFARAQDPADYLTIAAPPDWVLPITAPTTDLDADQGREVNYILIDQQKRHTADTMARFDHRIEHLTSPSAVEQNATISFDFDPAYQTVVIHHIHRIRDGISSDILDPMRFQLYRAETDRELLIYNGRLQASYLTPDVRVGDMLDYAYTVRGKNPAVGPHFYTGFQHAYGVPVQHIYQRVLTPSDVDTQFKPYADAPTPTTTVNGDMTETLWDLHDVPAKLIEDDLPANYVPLAQTAISSFKDWASVGSYFAPFYDVADLQSDAVTQIAADIRTANTTQQTQLRAALDYVQHEIRYLGIELGAGGYIPRQPDAVLANRFGDCKDMTVLLIAILHALDINATPLLVDTEVRENIDTLPPSYGVFNHVVVRATLDETTYVLDPTRGVQLGDLDHLQQGMFGKGVIIAADSPGMIDAMPDLPPLFSDIVDTFDLTSDPNDITITNVATYYGGEADRTLSWFNWTGQEAVDKSYLDYFQNTYPNVTQLSGVAMTVDHDNATVILTARYLLADGWSLSDNRSKESFSAYASEATYNMPEFVGASRSMPFAIAHPIRVSHTLRFLLDENWTLEDADETFDEPAFFVQNIERYGNDILTKTVTYRTKASSIAATDFAKSMDMIDRSRDLEGIQLFRSSYYIGPNRYTPSGVDATASATSVLLTFLVILGLLVLFLMRGAIRMRLSNKN